MLKVRIVPTLLFKDVGLVKGIGFDSWRRVGPALSAVKVYNMREVDELVFFDITATPEGRRPDLQQIEALAAECFMPMTVGGGVRTVEDIRALLMVGADKVAMNTAAIETPDLVRQGAERFGTQCIVVGIDARKTADGWQVFSHCGKRPTDLDIVEHAQRMEALGAGEIIVTSIDRDGTMLGYDVELMRKVSDAVRIPVIASGGAGNYQHMAELLHETRGAAVAAASIYHFTEQTPREAKLYLQEQGFPTRRS